MLIRTALLFLVLLMPSALLHAAAPPHNAGQTYLYLSILENEIEARVEITVGDLEQIFGFDIPSGRGSGVTRDEVRDLIAPRLDSIRAYIESNLYLGVGDEPFTLTFTEFDILRARGVDDFVRLHYTTGELDTVPDVITIEFTPMFDIEPDHEDFLLIEYNWKTATFNNESNVSLVFTPEEPRQTFDLSSASVWTGFAAMLRLGMKHIFEGIDHILFLLALVLPAVLFREDREWKPVPRFRSALWNIVKIVTFFTIAHSITLSLGALEIVYLSSRLVESVIALSIAAAALHNLYPRFVSSESLIAFVFGLFHGFGFASLLAPLGLGRDHMLLTLLGFNLGVEIGQVIIVALIFPILFLIRRQRWYVPVVLKGGSIVLIGIALFWFVERAFELPLTERVKDVLRPFYHRIIGR